MTRSILLGVFSVLFISLLFACDEDTEEGGDKEPGEACNGTIDCTPGSICWNEICIQDGVLRLSLAWTEETDLDLHVETPVGDHIYFSNKEAGGGELDVDDCVGGNCTTPGGTHVENVFFDSSASSGTYSYWVVNYDCDMAANWNMEVAQDGNAQETPSGTLAAECVESEHYTYSY